MEFLLPILNDTIVQQHPFSQVPRAIKQMREPLSQDSTHNYPSIRLVLLVLKWKQEGSTRLRCGIITSKMVKQEVGDGGGCEKSGHKILASKVNLNINTF